MTLIEWLRQKLPSEKGKPLVISWSWRCDPEIWLASQIKKLAEKVKDRYSPD